MTTLLENTTDRLNVAEATELELLVELTARERISPTLLVRNLLDILREEPGLLVDVVLQLTDPNRDYGTVLLEDYATAYATVAKAPEVRARQVLLRALEESALRAGYPALNAQAA